MTNLMSIVRRASILGAFVALTSLTPSGLTPFGLAAEDQQDATAASASNPAGSPSMTAPAPERCSALAPCQVARDSKAVELDLGGPSIRIEYFSDDD